MIDFYLSLFHFGSLQMQTRPNELGRKPYGLHLSHVVDCQLYQVAGHQEIWEKNRAMDYEPLLLAIRKLQTSHDCWFVLASILYEYYYRFNDVDGGGSVRLFTPRVFQQPSAKHWLQEFQKDCVECQTLLTTLSNNPLTAEEVKAKEESADEPICCTKCQYMTWTMLWYDNSFCPLVKATASDEKGANINGHRNTNLAMGQLKEMYRKRYVKTQRRRPAASAVAVAKIAAASASASSSISSDSSSSSAATAAAIKAVARNPISVPHSLYPRNELEAGKGYLVRGVYGLFKNGVKLRVSSAYPFTSDERMKTIRFLNENESWINMGYEYESTIPVIVSGWEFEFRFSWSLTTAYFGTAKQKWVPSSAEIAVDLEYATCDTQPSQCYYCRLTQLKINQAKLQLTPEEWLISKPYLWQEAKRIFHPFDDPDVPPAVREVQLREWRKRSVPETTFDACKPIDGLFTIQKMAEDGGGAAYRDQVQRYPYTFAQQPTLAELQARQRQLGDFALPTVEMDIVGPDRHFVWDGRKEMRPYHKRFVPDSEVQRIVENVNGPPIWNMDTSSCLSRSARPSSTTTATATTSRAASSASASAASASAASASAASDSASSKLDWSEIKDIPSDDEGRERQKRKEMQELDDEEEKKKKESDHNPKAKRGRSKTRQSKKWLTRSEYDSSPVIPSSSSAAAASVATATAVAAVTADTTNSTSVRRPSKLRRARLDSRAYNEGEIRRHIDTLMQRRKKQGRISDLRRATILSVQTSEVRSLVQTNDDLQLRTVEKVYFDMIREYVLGCLCKPHMLDASATQKDIKLNDMMSEATGPSANDEARLRVLDYLWFETATVQQPFTYYRLSCLAKVIERICVPDASSEALYDASKVTVNAWLQDKLKTRFTVAKRRKYLEDDVSVLCGWAQLVRHHPNLQKLDAQYYPWDQWKSLVNRTDGLDLHTLLIEYKNSPNSVYSLMWHDKSQPVEVDYKRLVPNPDLEMTLLRHGDLPREAINDIFDPRYKRTPPTAATASASAATARAADPDT